MMIGICLDSFFYKIKIIIIILYKKKKDLYCIFKVTSKVLKFEMVQKKIITQFFLNIFKIIIFSINITIIFLFKNIE